MCQSEAKRIVDLECQLAEALKSNHDWLTESSRQQAQIGRLKVDLAEAQAVAASRVGADPAVRDVLLHWFGTTEPDLISEAMKDREADLAKFVAWCNENPQQWVMRKDALAAYAASPARVKLPAEIQQARLMEALDRVLTEAGLQAHKVGCANRLVRPAKWDDRLACPGCLAEDALALAAIRPTPPEDDDDV